MPDPTVAMVASERFTHTPLSNADGQLRLLKVSSLRSTRDGHESIDCELVTCDIDDAPSYIAVSYTWGDPTRTKAITVNGKELIVRHNCWYVLWQASTNKISALLWIDAICINQLDDDEKSFQVAMMGSIYRNAEQVNVCLGPHSDNSQLLFDATKEHAVFVEEKLRHYHDSGGLEATLAPLQRQGRVDSGVTEGANVLTMSLFSQAVRAMLLEEMGTRDTFSSMSRKALDVLTEARYCLTDRPYFTRLWICQEILLGRRVILMVGESSVNFDDFLDLDSDIDSYCLRQKSPLHSGVEFDSAQEFLSIVNIRNSWSSTGMGLLELTDIFSSFQCFDVRDRIFGMLGMVDWQGYPPMVPDYKKTAFEIGTETISYMCPQLEEGSPGRDNTTWPIVSAMQIASALSLDAFHPEVNMRLQARRPRRHDPRTPAGSAHSKPIHTSSHVEVFADFYYELFTSEDSQEGSLHACIIDLDHKPDGAFSNRVLELDPDQTGGSCLVSNKSSPRVRVSNTARAGDILMSFRINGTEVGLVVRKDQGISPKHLIMGQSVFHEATIPCPGGNKCSCGFENFPHQKAQTRMKVLFHPEDLLLFACQDLHADPYGEDPERAENLRRYETIHAGEMTQVASLEALRFGTSVVKPGEPKSSYAEVIHTTRKSVKIEEERDMVRKKLEALQLHLNSWKIASKD